MTILDLRQEIGPGPDKQIEPLFDGPRRKVVQITLRNDSTLQAHKVDVPIVVLCIAGRGTFMAGSVVEMVPGVLVTLEAGEVHELAAKPEIRILLTRFVGDA